LVFGVSSISIAINIHISIELRFVNP
jgi:hypothetical protein